MSSPNKDGKDGKGKDDGAESPYASPEQRRAFEEGCGRYGDDICHNCHQRGHWKAECAPDAGNSNMTCINCGSRDHSQYNCPEESQNVVVAAAAGNEAEESHPESEEETN